MQAFVFRVPEAAIEEVRQKSRDLLATISRPTEAFVADQLRLFETRTLRRRRKSKGHLRMRKHCMGGRQLRCLAWVQALEHVVDHHTPDLPEDTCFATVLCGS